MTDLEKQVKDLIGKYFKNKKQCIDIIGSGAKDYLEKNYPNLLPEVINTTRISKEKLLEMAKNGEDKPNFRTSLYGKLLAYTRIRSKMYDPKFSQEIKKLRPDWFENYIEKLKRKSYEKMKKLIPTDLVEYDESQEWKGVTEKHRFICKKYGEFYSTPVSLIRRPWCQERSGHPKMGKETISNSSKKRGEKYIICNETDVIYNSVSDMSEKLNINKQNIYIVLKGKQKSTKGYSFRYATDEEIKKYKKRKK